MKQLLVLRHAKSSWKHSDLADHDRPLNKRGKRDAPRMGMLVRYEDLVPDLILTSSAKRAKTTAELFGEACDYDGEIIISRDLYAHYPEAYLEELQKVTDLYQCVLIVGHNPGLEELVEMMTDEWNRLPTAALAHISLSIQYWHEIDDDTGGELLHLWLPKELPD